MPKYDPRYNYPRGYEFGNTALGLADLLGQGFDRMHRWDQDAQGQENNQRDYLMRLQQFMQQSDAQGLDRQLKERQIAGLEDERTAKAAERDAAAKGAAAKQSGLFKALTQPPDVTAEAPPPPAFAADPERLQPNILQALVKRPRTLAESAEGMTPAEAGNPDVMELLFKRFQPKEPKAPEDFTLGEGQTRFSPTGKTIANVPPKVTTEKEPPPSAERDYRNQAIENLGGGASEAAIGKETRRLALADQEKIAGVRSDAALHNQMAAIDAHDIKTRQLKADEASSELAQVDKIMSRIETAVPKVNTPGLLGRAAGLTTRKLAEFAQTNPDINELAALGQGYVSVIAKIVQRQSGVLSNQDLDRATKSVPLPEDELGVAMRKVEVLRDILGTAKQNIAVLRSGKPQQTSTESGGGTRIRVRRKADGLPGSILESDFDPSKYERVN